MFFSANISLPQQYHLFILTSLFFPTDTSSESCVPVTLNILKNPHQQLVRKHKDPTNTIILMKRESAMFCLPTSSSHNNSNFSCCHIFTALFQLYFLYVLCTCDQITQTILNQASKEVQRTTNTITLKREGGIRGTVVACWTAGTQVERLILH